MSETRVGELLESAVPPLPEPPDRLAAVRGKVRRTRLVAGGVAAGAVACAVAVAVAVPAILSGADGAEPAPAGPSEGLACPPADPTRDLRVPDPPTEPQGGPVVPPGAVTARLCEREPSSGDVIYAPILTTNVEQVVDTLNRQPVEWGGSPNICYHDAGGDRPAGSLRWLVLGYPGGQAVTVTWNEWCGSWTAGGQVRFRDDVSQVFYQLYAEQAGLSPPPSGAPPFTEPAEVEVGETYRLTIFTHCGVDTIEFDGRAWRPERVGRASGLWSTVDITYVDRDTLHLTLVDGVGAGRTFVLQPTDNPSVCD